MVARTDKESVPRLSNLKVWDEVWEKHPQTEIVYGTEKGKTRERFYSQILPKREGLTLDLGCGDGHMQPYIKNYVGCDISRNALRKFNAIRVCGHAEQLPFRDGIFDHILLCETLEHVKERNRALSECYRILKRNGEIIVSSPYGNHPYHVSSTKPMQEYGLKLRDYLDGRFNERYLTTLLVRNGFVLTFIKVIKIKNVPNNLFVIGEK